MLGAERHERTDERLGYRNGSRPRLLTTQVGDVPLSIPKLRAGLFFQTILVPRLRIDQAPCAVIMEAWVKGISTRKVDALVAIGCRLASPARRSAASVRGSTARFRRYWSGRWTAVATRTSTWMRRTCTAGSAKLCRFALVPLLWPWV